MIALGGMIVDDVEDDLDAGIVQARDGRTKFVKRPLQCVARRGRKKAERVIPPIVAQSALDQVSIVDEGMDR